MSATFVIVWTSQYGREEIDTADTRREAEFLRREYQTAFHEGAVSIRRTH